MRIKTKFRLSVECLGSLLLLLGGARLEDPDLAPSVRGDLLTSLRRTRLLQALRVL